MKKNRQIALVTGGIKGIGAAIATRLKKAGYHVLVNYAQDETQAQRFSAETEIPILRWDISDYDACAENVSHIEHKLGRIAVLVNNAGIIRDCMMHKMDVEKWHQVINTNLGGTFFMCRAVIESMRAASYGRIVNISSVNALAGCVGQVNYAASKAGIIGLTKSLALENAKKNITVNAIAPGYIKTDMTSSIQPEIMEKLVQGIPVKKIGTPEDIARAVLFLVEDENGFITGETLSVNGGHYMQ